MIRNKLHIATNFSSIRAIALDIVIALLLFLTMFSCCYSFVEPQIVPKWYAFIAGTVFLCGVVLLSSKIPRITIDSITICALIFLSYLLIRNIFETPNPISIKTLSLASFISLYLMFKILKGKEVQVFNCLVIIVCLLQTGYGILQYIGYMPALVGFTVISSFDNPGGYAACLAA